MVATVKVMTSYYDYPFGIFKLFLHLEINSKGRLKMKLDDDYNIPIVNFPFICSNIPAAPV
jgi:hypothetical protein